ncbi:hypothetical protein OX90_04935 [Pseudomonas coronafaciens pv. porri]|uniref:Uncharacterized protein n=1 Tax=Pseudomonas coronafaciens pv. porri TaxID=83964 RepID=A0ABR5JT68_9PSED|nr:hypothetical protein OX88_21525 [Pseudomonas coronafaciens pv. porri]KOP60626.1 hypothetical protein OX90_04935 [Pseudomonas coronafaciens pv. porri]
METMVLSKIDTRERALKWTIENIEKQTLTDNRICPSFSIKMDRVGNISLLIGERCGFRKAASLGKSRPCWPFQIYLTPAA